MGSTDKKIAVGLVVALVALIAVYFAMPNLGVRANDASLGPGMTASGQPASAPGTDAACATDTGGASVATQEFGKPGARVEVIALLPITHGCHVTTEAELKKIQEKHPQDVHLIIVDLFGPESQQYLDKLGGGMRTLVAVNGKTTFDLNGRQVILEKQEGMTYNPPDLAPIIEAEIGKAA